MIGDFCGQCKKDYGISLDLRKCVKDRTCGAIGVTIFLLTCEELQSITVEPLNNELQSITVEPLNNGHFGTS